MVMRSLFSAMVFGWIVSAWVPVPGVIKDTANTLASAFTGGVKAVAEAVNPPPPKQAKVQ